MTLAELVKCGFEIFDNSWCTFIPSHKKELCDKIIRRYAFYEIGQETPEMFKFYINEHLARIMPYYNQLYKSELLKIEPLYNTLIETSGDENSEQDSNRDRSNLTANNRLLEMAKSIREMMGETQDITGNIDFTGNITGTETTDATENENTVGDKDKNRVENEEVDETSNQQVNENITGTKDITSKSEGTSSSQKYYSDTPQTSVSPDSLKVDLSYLTNYTQDSGTSAENTTSNEKIVTDTNRTTDETKNTTRDTTEDTTEHETIKRDLESNENKVSKEDTTNNTTEKNNKTTDRDSRGFQNETNRESETGSAQEAEKSTNKLNKKYKSMYKGYNTDQSTLLLRFRETFLNIDADIISQLSNNFMEVF